MKQCSRIDLKWLPIVLAPLVLCSGCSILPPFNKVLSGNRAFIDYWPSDPNRKELRLAVKDNIDMKGVVTTAGSGFFSQTHQPAEKDAACLAVARRRKVQIVGKTNMTEFAISPSGMNEYFGTPVNPLKRSLIPGGSSSGNAVAVASGMADVAFGTDTAGSIRVPAACCGIVGLKTTFGLIPIEGVYPVEPASRHRGPDGERHRSHRSGDGPSSRWFRGEICGRQGSKANRGKHPGRTPQADRVPIQKSIRRLTTHSPRRDSKSSSWTRA